MEFDGKTRIYITGSNKTAWQTYPEYTGRESRLEGAPAAEILERADYRAVDYASYDNGTLTKKTWIVFPEGTDESFELDRMGLRHDEEYPKLAEALEVRAGKKGLTITVS